jgi:hypothetical protein
MRPLICVFLFAILGVAFADFTIDLKRARARVANEFPMPKSDPHLQERVMACVTGDIKTPENCVKDISKFHDFLVNAFKHNWSQKQLTREVTKLMSEAKDELQTMTIEQREEKPKHLPVRPATEEEKVQHRQGQDY